MVGGHTYPMFARIRTAWKRHTQSAAQNYMICPYCHQWGAKGQCTWCGFDSEDVQAVNKLVAERSQQTRYGINLWERVVRPISAALKGRDQKLRTNYMICPQCHQWGGRGICQWCGFSTLDEVAVAHLRTEEARARAQLRARRQKLFQRLNELFRIDLREQWSALKMIGKWSILSGLVGVLAGSASALFLITLQWATNQRLANPNLLLLLPIVGFVLGWIYHRFAGTAARGNNLIIEEVNTNKEPIPARMAPLVLLGTILTHLFGGSAGREGTAIQMASSLADWLQRRLGLRREDRRLMLMAGISGGFGSVFGTPIAGFVFGLEVQRVGRVRYEGVLPCLIASIVGDLVTRMWGATHSHYPALLHLEPDPLLLLKVAVAGVFFGLTSLVFIELTHGIKHAARHLFQWAPFRPLVGGVVIMVLVLLVGSQDYLGLSLPLIQRSLDGTGVIFFAFLLKLVFTAVTLGTGFLGGEVTPLFVIGSTLGFTLGRLLGIDPVWMASIGFVAVFAGASNTPLACALMGMELFGSGSALYLILGTFIAYVASGHRSIYVTQRIGAPKVADMPVTTGESLEEVSARRSGWLAPIPGFTGSVAHRLIRSVMSPDPISVTPDTSLERLVELAIREGVRTLPVVDQNGIVVGIVTDNDLLRRSKLAMRLGLMASLSGEERRHLLTLTPDQTAAEIMTSPAITITQTQRLYHAEKLMTDHGLKRVPVVDQEGHLMGMITRSDLLRELVFSETSVVWQTEGHDIPLAWNAPVEAVMTAEITFVAPTASLSQVIQAMLNNHQKRIMVVDQDNQLIGLITDGDLLERSHHDHRHSLLNTLPSLWKRQAPVGGIPFDSALQSAADVMTSPVVSVPVGTTARDALRLLMERQIKRLPVVDDRGQVVGLVGRAGLMRALLKKSDLKTLDAPQTGFSRTA